MSWTERIMEAIYGPAVRRPARRFELVVGDARMEDGSRPPESTEDDDRWEVHSGPVQIDREYPNGRPRR